jgi:phage-related protein
MATNLYQELKDLLTEFKTFLDTNVNTIKPVVQALAALVPQINQLIDLLIGLMGKLKTEISQLNVGAIPDLAKVTEFTDKVKALLQATKSLLPNEAADIDTVLGAADVVGGLPSLDNVKAEIISLIDEIVTLLGSLKSA